MKKLLAIVSLAAAGCTQLHAQSQFYNNPGSNHGNRFEELGFLLATPNEYRTASGAPGPKYWQQKADYDIDVTVDEPNNRLTGSETITYFNNSPNPLSYLWLQVDENIHNGSSDNNLNSTGKLPKTTTVGGLEAMDPKTKFEGYGVNLTRVTDGTGKALHYVVVQTMMRVDLPTPLQPGQRTTLKINWNYKINDKATRGGRGGYEHFDADDNNLYSITQWYPRMAVYSDFKGWQNQQFTGGAEFALTFGDFKVRITTPADHVVAATGECQNYKQMLTAAQYNRWVKAQNFSSEPTEIVTRAEALETRKTKSNQTKTWIYYANNVRDFAFNTSRRLAWDAMATNVEGRKVMAMSYYGDEAYPLYRKYSTKVIAHTLKVYSKHTIPYPYPVAISVEAANGMEYPMISMNYGRTEKDGTYSEATKYGMIGVIIHEVGHNFFPMIVNSDERQWWWMDEGLNTFCQFLAEQEFDNNYPSQRGPAHKVVDYMRQPKENLEPIMTKGDYVAAVGSNAYLKASTGLNILRETVMGRELFDFAFKEYAKRWAFKHPTPEDLFRTLEDASGLDIDWFIRGWYFGTDPVDIRLDSVKWAKLDDAGNAAAFSRLPFRTIGQDRNKADTSIHYAVDADTALKDYYYQNPGADAALREAAQAKADAAMTDTANLARYHNTNLYELTFSNVGGMVMPIIIEWTYKDGSKEVERVPVTIWRLNEKQVSKVFMKNKEVTAIRLDPFRETADTDESNGQWPLKEMPSRFQLFKSRAEGMRGQSSGGNAMQQAARQSN